MDAIILITVIYIIYKIEDIMLKLDLIEQKIEQFEEE